MGFETIPNYAEESRNPRRIGAQALFICVIGGGLFFAVCAWAAVTGWGLHNAVHEAATNGGNFYYGVTTKFAAVWVTDVMEWLIMTSSFACALSFHNTTVALPVRDRPGEDLPPRPRPDAHEVPEPARGQRADRPDRAAC